MIRKENQNAHGNATNGYVGFTNENTGSNLFREE